MEIGFGWTGKILRVDLTARRWYVESTYKYAERFVGGIGIALKILWDEYKPDVKAFDPENKIIFAPGPLTGTLAPASGRFEIVKTGVRLVYCYPPAILHELFQLHSLIGFLLSNTG